MNTFPFTEQPLAHFNLVCVSSSLLLERVLQTLRYRSFQLVSLNFNPITEQEVVVSLVVKGQGKLTTLQKSFETIVEVQECYLTEDQAKLATLLDMGHISSPESTNHLTQQTAG